MTLIELIVLADAAYTKDFPESSLMECVHKQIGEPLKRLPIPIGDTLALFVVRELAETYDPEAGDSPQIAEAIRVMEMARHNLENIITALERRLVVWGD